MKTHFFFRHWIIKNGWCKKSWVLSWSRKSITEISFLFIIITSSILSTRESFFAFMLSYELFWLSGRFHEHMFCNKLVFLNWWSIPAIFNFKLILIARTQNTQRSSSTWILSGSRYAHFTKGYVLILLNCRLPLSPLWKGNWTKLGYDPFKLNPNFFVSILCLKWELWICDDKIELFI